MQLLTRVSALASHSLQGSAPARNEELGADALWGPSHSAFWIQKVLLTRATRRVSSALAALSGRHGDGVTTGSCRVTALPLGRGGHQAGAVSWLLQSVLFSQK